MALLFITAAVGKPVAPLLPRRLKHCIINRARNCAYMFGRALYQGLCLYSRNLQSNEQTQNFHRHLSF